jgi:hypothetical protein
MVIVACGHVKNGEARLNDAIVNIIAAPIVGPAALGNDFIGYSKRKLD